MINLFIERKIVCQGFENIVVHFFIYFFRAVIIFSDIKCAQIDPVIGDRIDEKFAQAHFPICIIIINAVRLIHFVGRNDFLLAEHRINMIQIFIHCIREIFPRRAVIIFQILFQCTERGILCRSKFFKYILLQRRCFRSGKF